jgi:hypothetical protein
VVGVLGVGGGGGYGGCAGHWVGDTRILVQRHQHPPQGEKIISFFQNVLARVGLCRIKKKTRYSVGVQCNNVISDNTVYVKRKKK